MIAKFIAGSFIVLGLAIGGMLAADKKADDCCSLKLACCTTPSACCVADAKLACCEKGQKCCADNKACCAAVQKCCTTGSACCDAAKACCGPATAKHDDHAAHVAKSNDHAAAMSCCAVKPLVAQADAAKANCCSKDAKCGGEATAGGGSK